MVYEVTPTVVTYYVVKTNGSTDDYNTVNVMFFCYFQSESMKKVIVLVSQVAEYIDIKRVCTNALGKFIDQREASSNADSSFFVIFGSKPGNKRL